MKIIETNWAIANTYEDGIEINERLNEFPELREKVIRHELEHSKSKSFVKNRKIDALTEIKFKEMFPFIKKYPLNFLQQIIPFNYSKEKNTLYIEWSLLILYLLGIGLLIGSIFIINSFSDTKEIFSKIIFNSIWILIIVIVILYMFDKFKKSVNSIDWKKDTSKPKGIEKKLRKLGIK